MKDEILVYRLDDSRNLSLPLTKETVYSYQFEYLGESNISGSRRPDLRIDSSVVGSTLIDKCIP
jgi:hypothetical protein